MSSPKRQFAPIPLALDEDDKLIDEYAANQGIPDSRKAAPTAPVAQVQEAKPVPVEVAAVPRIDLRKVTFELPAYALRALKQKALDEDVSIRLVLMRGLVAQGIEIDAADLIEDGRRRPRG